MFNKNCKKKEQRIESLIWFWSREWSGIFNLTNSSSIDINLLSKESYFYTMTEYVVIPIYCYDERLFL